MSFTNPYRQHNYMGEYLNEAFCLNFIRANNWDSNKNGTGNPENGMWFYDGTLHKFKGYINGSWEEFGNESVSVLQGMSTSLLSGGELNINLGDNTTFDVLAGHGIIVDNTTDPDAPTIQRVSWNNSSGNASFAATPAPATIIWIDETGSIQTTFTYDPETSRNWIYLGFAVHTGSVIESIEDGTGGTTIAVGSQITDLSRAIGIINTDPNGNIFSGNVGALTLSKTAGNIHVRGINYKNNPKDPSNRLLPAANPVSFAKVYRDGVGGFIFTNNVTNITPSLYDDGSGTLATVGATEEWTIQRIYLSRDNSVVVHYGQNTYATKERAYASIETENFEVAPILNETLFRGWLIIKRTCSDLSDIGYAVFVDVDRYGIHPFGSSINEGGIWSENVLYIGKHGNDGNGGESPDNAFLTFGAAIAKANSAVPPISSTNRYMFLCEDAGTYTEDITIPAWCYLSARAAVLDGQINLTDVCVCDVGKITTSGTRTASIYKVGSANARASILCENIEFNRTLTNSGAITINNGSLDISIRRIKVSANNYAISSSFSGVTEITGVIGNIGLNNNASAFNISFSNQLVNVNVSSIIKEVGSTGTTAIRCLNGSGSINCNRIDTDTAVNISGGVVNLSNSYMAGAIVETGGTLRYVSSSYGAMFGGRVRISDNANTPPFSLTPRNTEPLVPVTIGDMYLDSGANTITGFPNLRSWNGVDWNDLGFGIIQTGNSSQFPLSANDGMFFWNTDIKTIFQWVDGAWKPMISYGPVTIYVDGNVGLDAIGNGYGAGASAFSTIQYAIDNIPSISGGDIVIYIEPMKTAPYAYDEPFSIKGKFFSGGYSLKLIGSVNEYNAARTITSSTTGSTTTSGTITVSGTPYSGIDLSGKLVYIIGNNEYKVIKSNTSSVITICNYFSSLPTGDFLILDWEQNANTTTITDSTNAGIKVISSDDIYFINMRIGTSLVTEKSITYTQQCAVISTNIKYPYIIDKHSKNDVANSYFSTGLTSSHALRSVFFSGLQLQGCYIINKAASKGLSVGVTATGNSFAQLLNGNYCNGFNNGMFASSLSVINTNSINDIITNCNYGMNAINFGITAGNKAGISGNLIVDVYQVPEITSGAYKIGGINNLSTTSVLELENLSDATLLSVRCDGGILAPSLKSGVDQASAGAVAGELWVDSTNNTIKIGI